VRPESAGGPGGVQIPIDPDTRLRDAETSAPTCRSCAGRSGNLVLDLGSQPACNQFPAYNVVTGSDPSYPLKMWLCSSCGLAQLLGHPTLAEEIQGAEPEALVAQAVDAVEHLAATGWLSERSSVGEFASPHGGSWLKLLEARGLAPVSGGRPADLVIDSFGMMHDANQFSALADRAARVTPGGVLLLQYHSLATIMRLGQWNALRHGHFAYYSTKALVGMLASIGFRPRSAWQFDLYGGTILLAATRESDGGAAADASVDALLDEDARLGVDDPSQVGNLQRVAESHVCALHGWLVDQRSKGASVLGYGAASRSVALLCRARVDQSLLPAIVDVSPSKHGLRMPGTDIPIVSPEWLATDPPHTVLLFVPDLLAEVRHAFPHVEESGGSWVDAEAL
jgi:C-methyltransferase C-terminal domain/Putative zinc binding domain